MDINIRKIYLTNAIAVTVLYLVLFSLIRAGVLSNYYVGIIISSCIMIVMAMSLNIAAGWLGQMALGHAGFMAIGAYTSSMFSIAVINSGAPIPGLVVLILAMLIGGITAGIFGVLIGGPVLRLQGDYLGIVTIGFSEIIRIFFVNFQPTGGGSGLKGITKLISFDNAFWFMVIIVILIFTLGRSKHGRGIISIREDEIAAEAAGIPTTFYKVLGFTLAAFFGGIGGAMYAHYQAFLEPKKFSFMFSIEMFVIVVLGGLGSLTGSIISAIVLTTLPELLRGFSEYRLLVYSLVLIIMMIFRPQGLMGRSEFSLTQFIDSLRQRRQSKNTVGGGEL